MEHDNRQSKIFNCKRKQIGGQKMNIDKAITKEQNNLIKIAKTKGLYENFGQKEVRKLEDKFIDSSDYSEEMNKNRRLLQMFDEWCMNYCG